MKWISFALLVLGLSQGVKAQIVVQKAKPMVIQVREDEALVVKKESAMMPELHHEYLDSLKVTKDGGGIFKDVVAKTGRTARIRGWVKEPLSDVWLEMDQFKQPITVLKDGLFEQVVVLRQGKNMIRLMQNEDEEIDRHEIRAPELTIVPLRVTLTWDGFGDVDIYLKLPNGRWLWFDDKECEYGHLDVDNTVSNGPENISIFKKLQGTYKIYMHYYKGVANKGVSFRVDVFKDEILNKSFTGIVFHPSSSEYRPHNAGNDSSWVHVGDIHLK